MSEVDDFLKELGPLPHCDQDVLHAPGECQYCDKYPEFQAIRKIWGIAFTGKKPEGREISCPSDFRRGLDGASVWPNNRPSKKD